jgi:pimeloyl-ACP methyl ester carboxylesterase
VLAACVRSPRRGSARPAGSSAAVAWVAADTSYLGAVIDQLDGPIVLVGHSYSGSVITAAGVSDKVAGLVYVAGFVPEEGQTIADLQAIYPSLAMGNFLQPRPLPDGSAELSVDPGRFRDIFCADVPEADATFMAHAQRPLVATAFEEPAAAAAWKTKPSWAAFGTADKPIAPQLHRYSYERAGSKTTRSKVRPTSSCCRSRTSSPTSFARPRRRARGAWWPESVTRTSWTVRCRTSTP